MHVPISSYLSTPLALNVPQSQEQCFSVLSGKPENVSLITFDGSLAAEQGCASETFVAIIETTQGSVEIR